MDATVLIAEHDARWRNAFQRFLSECGFRVEVASNGLECLDKLRAVEPEVLIVDADMLWGGGDGVLAVIDEGEFPFHHPAVVVVGRAPRQVLSRRTGVPHTSCFEKPVEMERLLDKVALAFALRDLRMAESVG